MKRIAFSYVAEDLSPKHKEVSKVIDSVERKLKGQGINNKSDVVSITWVGAEKSNDDFIKVKAIAEFENGTFQFCVATSEGKLEFVGKERNNSHQVIFEHGAEVNFPKDWWKVSNS